jgi:hypothetical protein
VQNTITVEMGEAFPADDPVARFVVVLAMMSNDALRSFSLLDPDAPVGEAGAFQMWLFRQQAAMYVEAATFIGDSAHYFLEVATFIEGLPAEAKSEHERIVGGINRDSQHYVGAWLEPHRHVTFHYAEMHPEKAERGLEKIQQALRKVANKKGQITHGTLLHEIRFGFADVVARESVPPDEDTNTIVALREALLALVTFIQRAVVAYEATRPAGAFVRDDAPS